MQLCVCLYSLKVKKGFATLLSSEPHKEGTLQGNGLGLQLFLSLLGLVVCRKLGCGQG